MSKIAAFEPTGTVIFKHRHSCTNKSCVGKLAKLLFFEAGNIAITMTQISLLDVFLLFVFVMLSEPHEIQRKELS